MLWKRYSLAVVLFMAAVGMLKFAITLANMDEDFFSIMAVFVLLSIPLGVCYGVKWIADTTRINDKPFPWKRKAKKESK